MSSRRLSVGQGRIAALVAGSLLLASACSDNGYVTFDPIDGGESGATNVSGTKSTAGNQGTTAGKNAGGNGNQAGSGARAGSGGTDNGGTDTAGTDTGGTDTAGTDTGGTDTGGTNNGGTDTGGTETGGTDTGGTDTGGTETGGTDTGGTDTGGTSAGTGGTNTGGTNTGGTSAGTGGGPTCTPTTEICDGVDNDCDKAVDPGNTCPAGCTGATYNGHRYVFCGKVDSAPAAGTKCQGMGLSAVIIESAAENTFVTSKLKGLSWIGATDQFEEKHWIWAATNDVFWDDKPLDGKYSNWTVGQPNNNGAMGADENCAAISTAAATKGEWNDLACTSKDLSVACESLDSTD
jgi:hypothetical protein